MLSIAPVTQNVQSLPIDKDYLIETQASQIKFLTDTLAERDAQLVGQKYLVQLNEELSTELIEMRSENTHIREEASERIEELENQVTEQAASYEEKLDRCHARINAYEEDKSYTKRLLANKRMQSAHKLVFMAVRDEIRSRKVDQRGYTHIDFSRTGEKIGLSRQRVGARLHELMDGGAFAHYTDEVRVTVKGKSFDKEHYYLALNDIAIEAPEDIVPLIVTEKGKEWGGKRERCKNPACGSHNLKHIHHTKCMDCGYEYIASAPLTGEQEELLAEALDPVQDEQSEIHHDAIANRVDQAIEVVDQALLEIDPVQDEQGEIAPDLEEKPFGTCSGCGATNDTIIHPHTGTRICSCYSHPERRDAYRASKIGKNSLRSR